MSKTTNLNTEPNVLSEMGITFSANNKLAIINTEMEVKGEIFTILTMKNYPQITAGWLEAVETYVQKLGMTVNKPTLVKYFENNKLDKVQAAEKIVQQISELVIFKDQFEFAEANNNGIIYDISSKTIETLFNKNAELKGNMDEVTLTTLASSSGNETKATIKNMEENKGTFWDIISLKHWWNNAAESENKQEMIDAHTASRQTNSVNEGDIEKNIKEVVSKLEILPTSIAPSEDRASSNEVAEGNSGQMTEVATLNDPDSEGVILPYNAESEVKATVKTLEESKGNAWSLWDLNLFSGWWNIKASKEDQEKMIETLTVSMRAGNVNEDDIKKNIEEIVREVKNLPLGANTPVSTEENVSDVALAGNVAPSNKALQGDAEKETEIKNKHMEAIAKMVNDAEGDNQKLVMLFCQYLNEVDPKEANAVNTALNESIRIKAAEPKLALTANTPSVIGVEMDKDTEQQKEVSGNVPSFMENYDII